jgi:hypothetical protein
MDPQFSNNNGTTNNEAEDPLVMELPPGYKFIPDDVDLIDYYLKYKLAGFFINPPRIKDIEVYKYSPQELGMSYFFFILSLIYIFLSFFLSFFFMDMDAHYKKLKMYI